VCVQTKIKITLLIVKSVANLCLCIWRSFNTFCAKIHEIITYTLRSTNTQNESVTQTLLGRVINAAQQQQQHFTTYLDVIFFSDDKIKSQKRIVVLVVAVLLVDFRWLAVLGTKRMNVFCFCFVFFYAKLQWKVQIKIY